MNTIGKVSSYSGREAGEAGGSATDHFRGFSDWLTHYAILASLIILLCSLFTRLFLTLHSDPHDLKFPDSKTYLETSQSLMESGSFLNKSHQPEISRTPGYPVFLGTVMYVAGKELHNLLIAQTIVVSLSVVILYWLARRILPPVMAFTGTLLAAFSPWGAARAGFLLTEGLFLLVLVLLFYVMYLVVEHATKLSAVLLGGGCIGLLTSAVVFVRPVWPLVPLVALVIFLLCGDKRQRAWILIAAMLVCASIPLYLWKIRNLREAQFDGLSNTSGVTAHQMFASAVKAQVKGADGDRWAMMRAAQEEEDRWGLSLQETNNERWRLVQAVFREHPFLSVYVFALNTGESIIHPDPGILTPAALNFHGDRWVLGGIWAAMLVFAGLGLCNARGKERDGVLIQRKWLLSLLGICLLLTVASGLSFGGGSRFRAPLELIIPLLAGVGLVRVVSYFNRAHFYVPHQSRSGENRIG
jgi:4-amino-4-deoxy-L-arabinose transferase-like glycosyltransferase